MYKTPLIFCFLFIWSICSFSQRENRERATRELKSLSSGALIVRLVDRSLTYAELEKRGDQEKAEKLRASDKMENLTIIKGFQENFDFCKVYFILPSQSEFVANNILDKVEFVNANLEVDPSISPPKDIFFLTAEFALVDFSQVEHKDGKFYHYDDNGNLQVTDEYNRYEFSFPALIIKDEAFVQLERPFPFYVKTLESVPLLKRSKARVIQKMDEDLTYWLARGFY